MRGVACYPDGHASHDTLLILDTLEDSLVYGGKQLDYAPTRLVCEIGRLLFGERMMHKILFSFLLGILLIPAGSAQTLSPS